jgi:hypothetical protein
MEARGGWSRHNICEMLPRPPFYGGNTFSPGQSGKNSGPNRLRDFVVVICIHATRKIASLSSNSL